MSGSSPIDDAARPDFDATSDGHGLPRLLRHALAALNTSIAPLVAADVAASLPMLAAQAVEWAEHPGSSLWRRLAEGIDGHSEGGDRPALRDLADTVGFTSMSVSEAGLMHERSTRIASALDMAKRVAGRAGASASDLADVERLAIGWLALAAGYETGTLGHLRSAHGKAFDIGLELTDAIDLAGELAAGGVAGQESVGMGVGQVVVCPPVRGTTQWVSETVRQHSHAVGVALPLAATPDLAEVRRVLVDEYPYAVATIDGLLFSLVGRPFVRLPPTILLGPAGSGKSRLVRRLSELLGTGLWRTDAGRADSGSFAGTDRRWATSEPCHAFLAVSRCKVANPLLLVDELDKAGTSRRNGRIWDALLGFLERETSASYPDPQLQVDLDLSHVSYLMTCNDVGGLPGPLLDRCKVVEVPCPSISHMGALLPSILRAIARDDGIDEGWIEPLTPAERALVARHWRGGSVRHLARLVGAVLRGRARPSPSHWH